LSALVAGATVCNGRYRLDEVVGRGGMAIVWRATDLQLERPVAIKIISDVLAGDPRFAARFEREARLAAGLSHPNLVKIFDFSSEADRPLLVMEYIPGGTLVQRRADVDALELARELLDALAHIHGAGILHRDIKPANVLLDGSGAPRLTDFGIARSEDQTGLTLTGQVLGTLRYIAPEVAEGAPATERSDLYSLGVLLAQVAGDDPPAALAGLLERMTAKQAADRPGSAAEALAELEPTRALSDPRPLTETEPTQALPVNRPGLSSHRMHKSGRLPEISRRATLAAAVVLALLVAAVIALSAGDSDQQSATTPRAAPAAASLAQDLDHLERLIHAAPAAGSRD
jgi:serine/threonine protein kinase